MYFNVSESAFNQWTFNMWLVFAICPVTKKIAYDCVMFGFDQTLRGHCQRWSHSTDLGLANACGHVHHSGTQSPHLQRPLPGSNLMDKTIILEGLQNFFFKGIHCLPSAVISLIWFAHFNWLSLVWERSWWLHRTTRLSSCSRVKIGAWSRPYPDMKTKSCALNFRQVWFIMHSCLSSFRRLMCLVFACFWFVFRFEAHRLDVLGSLMEIMGRWLRKWFSYNSSGHLEQHVFLDHTNTDTLNDGLEYTQKRNYEKKNTNRNLRESSLQESERDDAQSNRMFGSVDRQRDKNWSRKFKKSCSGKNEEFKIWIRKNTTNWGKIVHIQRLLKHQETQNILPKSQRFKRNKEAKSGERQSAWKNQSCSNQHHSLADSKTKKSGDMTRRTINS